MDDLERKMFVQLDDDMPAQRANALEMLREHLKKRNRSFRALMQDIEKAEKAAQLEQENTTLQQQNAALQNDLTQHKAAVAQWQKHSTQLTRQLRTAKAIAWGRTSGLRLALFAALPLIALLGWQAYERYWPLPTGVNQGLRELAERTPWHAGFGQPVVRTIAGNPYWVLARGETDTAHADADGVPVGMHCVHLYAHPATADFGEYVKADPFGLFGWWIKWPERAVQCESFPLREAQQ